ncbi:MAG TPA: hypothetical protein VK557_07780, partial [Pyrinomonadaceae bacterium]|nr:hypothetical protein [Pyrinomonadaceae bacterium]
QTGGEIIKAGNHDVAEKLAILIDHLRFRYAIGFRPNDTTEDDKFRAVDITIASNRRNATTIVLTKRGYYFRRRAN